MSLAAATGHRLKAQRRAARLGIDNAARSAGISRALLYRYEAGEVVKLDVLERLADLYRVSLPVLLGADQEYVPDGVTFFEKLADFEAEATRILTVFGPLAYTLTSDAYDETLLNAVSAGRGAADGLGPNEIARLRKALGRRRAQLREGRTTLINIIPIAEIVSFLRPDATSVERDDARRRKAAREEMRHLCRLFVNPPLGVQVALTSKPLPTAGFQVLTLRDRTMFVASPFRLAEPINLRFGVATVSTDPHVVQLHEKLVSQLWADSLTGQAAADRVGAMIEYR